MKQQHCDAVSVHNGLEFSPIETVSEHVIVVGRHGLVLYQRYLGHEVFGVRFHVADHGKVSSGIRDVQVHDFPILAGSLEKYKIGLRYGQ